MLLGAAHQSPTLLMSSRPKRLPRKHQLWFDAIQAGDLATIKNMQSGSNKVPIDVARPDGRTGLIMASGNHDHETVAFLVDAGASIHCQSRSGHTALRAAIAPDWGGQYVGTAERSWEKTVSTLLRHGATLDQSILYGTLQSVEPARVDWLLQQYRKAIPFETASKAIAAAKPDHHERQVDEHEFRENVRLLLEHVATS